LLKLRLRKLLLPPLTPLRLLLTPLRLLLTQLLPRLTLLLLPSNIWLRNEKPAFGPVFLRL
jgi:hypothetical protein